MAIETFNLNDSGATIRTNLNANFSDLDTTKADLASPTFTGTVTLPTALTGVLKATSGVVSVQTGLTPFTIETTAGATHSLTTTAGQTVVVWAKGSATNGSDSTSTVLLNYNGVQKDTVSVGYPSSGGNKPSPFSLMYTETPGAATANITVTTGGTASDVVIIVMKIG